MRVFIFRLLTLSALFIIMAAGMLVFGYSLSSIVRAMLIGYGLTIVYGLIRFKKDSPIIYLYDIPNRKIIPAEYRVRAPDGTWWSDDGGEALTFMSRWEASCFYDDLPADKRVLSEIIQIRHASSFR